MARKTARPGRTLGVFFLGLAIAFGLVALAGSWKPELGLDLQGGTSIRLTAKGNPSTESLNEARKIVDQRVNGSGVAEAEVTVQGNRYIVVEIPGKSRRDLVETVKRQAQLRFRLVACSDSDPSRCQASAGSTTTPQDPTAPQDGSGAGVTAPASPTAGATPAPRPTPRPTPPRPPTPRRRPAAPTAPASATPTPPARARPSPPARRLGLAEPTRRPSTAPSDAGTADDRPGHPQPRRRQGRRRPAEVDRRAQPGGDRRLQRVHLPAGRLAGQRRGRPRRSR